VGETLLEPTTIYVRAIMELLRSGVEVRGLAHITSGGLLNLLRLEAAVGYEIGAPLPRLPVFDLIAARSRASEGELLEVFNMGCGFCCVVPADQTDMAVELLDSHHPGSAVIGRAIEEAGVVKLPGLTGTPDGGFSA
jgi:phosphoribosylformylglycinamidine cyclo-ligase